MSGAEVRVLGGWGL